MKKAITIIFVLIISRQGINAQCAFSTSITPSGPTTFCQNDNVTLVASNTITPWTQKTNFSSIARQNAVAFSIGTKGYAGLGSNNSGTLLDFWEYNATTDTWTQKANFPGQGRYNMSYFTIGNKGYVCSGQIGFNNLINDLWEYDPSNDTWTQKANPPSAVKRHSASGFSVGNKGYLTLGQDINSNYLNDLWEYDPSNDSWTQKANYGGSARAEATAFNIGNMGYVGTGTDGGGLYKNDFWEYDPTTDTWIQKANYGIGTRAFGSTAFVVNNKAYMTTGFGNNTAVEYELWQYEPALDTWTKKEDFPGTHRAYAYALSISGKAYLGTGYDLINQLHLNDIWEYDPSTFVSYLWSTGQTTQSITTGSTGTYSVILTSAAGCTATASQTVQVNSSPLVGTNNPADVCPGESSVINASVIGGGSFTYTWSTGAIGAQITVTPTLTSIYTVSVSATNGCIGEGAVQVTVKPLPDINVTINSTAITVNESNSTYQWYECFTSPPPTFYNIIPGETHQTYTASANSNYAVIVTNSLGCKDTSSCITISGVGIEELNINRSLTIYPNPNDGDFTMQAKNKGMYTIVNTMGETIKLIELKEENQKVKIDNLARGVYFIIGGLSRLKIIVTK